VLLTAVRLAAALGREKATRRIIVKRTFVDFMVTSSELIERWW